jgi:hypothetical protein
VKRWSIRLQRYEYVRTLRCGEKRIKSRQDDGEQRRLIRASWKPGRDLRVCIGKGASQPNWSYVAPPSNQQVGREFQTAPPQTYPWLISGRPGLTSFRTALQSKKRNAQDAILVVRAARRCPWVDVTRRSNSEDANHQIQKVSAARPGIALR